MYARISFSTNFAFQKPGYLVGDLFRHFSISLIQVRAFISDFMSKYEVLVGFFPANQSYFKSFSQHAKWKIEESVVCPFFIINLWSYLNQRRKNIYRKNSAKHSK